MSPCGECYCHGEEPKVYDFEVADAAAVDRSCISVLVQGNRPIVPVTAPVRIVLSVPCR